MEKTPHPKLVAPIYTFAFVWLFFALVGISLNDFLEVVLMTILSLGASVIAYGIAAPIRWFRRRRNPAAAAAPPPKPLDADELAIETVINEGRALIAELENAKRSIQKQEVAHRTGEVIDISNKMIEKLRRQPGTLSAAKRFFSYYLPTTSKLITSYSYLESQGIPGGHISSTMQKIEGTLDTLTEAYKTQLDALFSHTALDLETDIQVLENILKAEGLIQSEFQTIKMQAEEKEASDEECVS